MKVSQGSLARTWVIHALRARHISPRLSDHVGEVLGRLCLLVSVSGASQLLVQSEWERVQAYYLPDPVSHISKSL